MNSLYCLNTFSIPLLYIKSLRRSGSYTLAIQRKNSFSPSLAVNSKLCPILFPVQNVSHAEETRPYSINFLFFRQGFPLSYFSPDISCNHQLQIRFSIQRDERFLKSGCNHDCSVSDSKNQAVPQEYPWTSWWGGFHTFCICSFLCSVAANRTNSYIHKVQIRYTSAPSSSCIYNPYYSWHFADYLLS